MEDKDQVIETPLRFCLSRKCVQPIKPSRHNIRPLGDKKVKKDPFLGHLTKDEKQELKDEQINVEKL